jgi:hypothetical protein
MPDQSNRLPPETVKWDTWRLFVGRQGADQELRGYIWLIRVFRTFGGKYLFIQ